MANISHACQLLYKLVSFIVFNVYAHVSKVESWPQNLRMVDEFSKRGNIQCHIFM